jgi:hypothetical protein
LSITTTCPGESFGASTRSTYASNAALVVLPTIAMHGPIPSKVMLASSVTFFPQLRGALHGARSPLRDQAYSGAREMFAPISSTNTSRAASIAPATKARQAALRNSSRSPAPTDLFFGSTPAA